MKIDVLVAEIGSTTTVVNAFLLGGHPHFVGQGQAATSVLEGDVRIGLQGAVDDLERALGEKAEYSQMYATSSAAGGLKMTVHGLIYDMTVRAAREAALGAGGIIKLATAGRLRRSDLEAIRAQKPNLILLAGGTDYGERDTAVWNAEMIARARFGAPVIYAGNVENQREVELIFREEGGQKVYLTENVYPKLDELNIEPTRRIIHKVFEEHITGAPGMEHVRDMVTGSIIPTPGAVMECAQLLYDDIGDLIVFDVGGATTDVHSVTDGSEEIGAMLTSPEPKAKRTVEGDLGVYVNARNVVDLIGKEALAERLHIDVDATLASYRAIPRTADEFKLVTALTETAAQTALERHAGHLRYVYTPSGRRTLAEGKDLTQVKWLVATGGALTRLPERERIMADLSRINKSGMMLFPKEGAARVLFDRDYIMASLGVLSKGYPREALALLKMSLGL